MTLAHVRRRRDGRRAGAVYDAERERLAAEDQERFTRARRVEPEAWAAEDVTAR